MGRSPRNGPSGRTRTAVETATGEQDASVEGLRSELEDLRQANRAQAALFHILNKAVASRDLAEFCASVHTSIRELVGADDAFVAVYHASTNTLQFPYISIEHHGEPPTRKLGNGLTDLVIRSRVAFHLSDPESARLLRTSGAEILGTRPIDWFGVPLRSGEDLIGVLAVQTYRPDTRFGEREKDLIEQASRQVSVALVRELDLKRLRDSEHRNRAMLGAIPDLMFVLSRDGYHLDFKAARREDLAIPPEKIIGSHIDDTGFSPDKLAEFKKAIADAIDTGKIHAIHYDLATPKGPGQWEARVARLDDERALTIVRDVTDRRRAERELAESEGLLQSVLEKMPVGIWLTDKTGKLTYANPEALRIWGGAKYVGPEQFGDYVGWWVADGKKIEPHEWAATRAIREGMTFINQEIEIQAFDGVKRTILNSAIPFRGERGELHGCFVVNQDITARRQEEEHRSRLEAQILQAQKLESLGVLAGGIAHDFNNLLVGILGNADLALMEVGTSSSARHYLEDLKRAAIRASELTNQMLAYSGKGRFVIEAVNINDLVHEMSHLLKVSISKRAVVKYHFFEQLPATEADPTQIRQVVMNLITNASDAIGNKSGIISLSTGVVEADEEFFAACQVHENPKPGYYVFVEVSDTGIGMDAETMARIFEPFFTTKFTGRGLGLAAVMGIARGHRGAVRVESQPGKGSTFTVYFPCQEALLRANLRAEKPAGRTQRGDGLVLVVDDEESVRNIAKIMLERHGFSVITAKDGRDAMKVFQKRAPEIAAVVLDMTMPHMGGEETFHKMLEVRPDIRVILASGYTEQEATAHFVGKGLAGFIQKPFQLADFVQKVCNVTAR